MTRTVPLWRWLLALTAVVAFAAYGCERRPDPMTAAVLVVASSGHGSGMAIGPRLVLTAAHVVDKEPDPRRDRVIGYDQRPRGYRVVMRDDQADLALLSVNADLPAHRSVACEVPTRGTPLVAYGHPLVVRWAEVMLRVTSVSPIAVNDPMRWRVLVVDGSINSGLSGAAVIGPSGDVVGVVLAALLQHQATSSELSSYGLVTHGVAICEFLDRAR